VDTFDEYRALVESLRGEWNDLWRCRIDDKVRAEGVASKDYPLLSVERGRVIMATRDYKPLDFEEVLQSHKPRGLVDGVPPSPAVGGWGKFIRTKLRRRAPVAKEKGREKPARDRGSGQQLKKGGKGWLHR